MEDLETIEVNVEDLMQDTYANESVIEASFNDVATDVDMTNNVNAKKVAPVNAYSEAEVYKDIPYDEVPANSSSILPLCITVIVCLAIGITLGIFAAKRASKK